MEDYLKFNKLITPVIIQIIFWIGVVGAVLSGLFTMFNGGFLAGLGILLLGPILVRIYTEIVMIMFKIHEELVKIRQKP